MTVEYLNLLQSKRIAGDADWLSAKLCSEYEAHPVSIQKGIDAFLHRSTGFMPRSDNLPLASRVSSNVSVE